MVPPPPKPTDKYVLLNKEKIKIREGDKTKIKEEYSEHVKVRLSVCLLLLRCVFLVSEFSFSHLFFECICVLLAKCLNDWLLFFNVSVHSAPAAPRPTDHLRQRQDLLHLFHCLAVRARPAGRSDSNSRLSQDCSSLHSLLYFACLNRVLLLDVIFQELNRGVLSVMFASFYGISTVSRRAHQQQAAAALLQRAAHASHADAHRGRAGEEDGHGRSVMQSHVLNLFIIPTLTSTYNYNFCWGVVCCFARHSNMLLVVFFSTTSENVYDHDILIDGHGFCQNLASFFFDWILCQNQLCQRYVRLKGRSKVLCALRSDSIIHQIK